MIAWLFSLHPVTQHILQLWVVLAILSSWWRLAPVWFIGQVLAYLLAPFIPVFAEWRYGPLDNNNAQGFGYRLPHWLAWFDTPDNALTGDAGHRERTAYASEYWAMVLWLWRNPAVGLDASVLAAKLAPDAYSSHHGDPLVQDAPQGRGGYCLTFVGDYWNWTYILPIGSRCLKIDLGWQLKTFVEGHPLELAARYAMSIRLPQFKT
jgi:hypothetical protein